MDKTEIHILYLDDEVNNLTSFKANFRRFYTVFTAKSPEEARIILKQTDIQIIITDQLMPNTTGVQFLESIIPEHPHPIRMILSAYAEIGVIMEAVNKGQIFHYLLKPFDLDDLKKIIEEAYDLYTFRKNDRIIKNKYKKVFEESNEALYVVDKECYFTEMNRAGMNLFKMYEAELRTFRIWDFSRDQGQLESATKYLSENKFFIDRPFKLRDMKNVYLDVLISCNTIFDETNNVIGHQGVIRDITKQKQTENLILRSVVETQESERTRIAKDIHDSVGQQLSAVQFYLKTLAETVKHFRNNLLLSKSTSALDTVLSDLRNICFNLIPNTIETFGLIETVNQLCRQNQYFEVLNFNVESTEDFPSLNKLLELSIFRIVQEFITNALKHGVASKISMKFEFDLNKIQITLKDNGKGFNVNGSDSCAGNGLKNIRSRILSYNGEINIKSQINIGTEFSIFIPINKSLLIDKIAN